MPGASPTLWTSVDAATHAANERRKRRDDHTDRDACHQTSNGEPTATTKAIANTVKGAIAVSFAYPECVPATAYLSTRPAGSA